LSDVGPRLEVLFEEAPSDGLSLPAELEDAYGGPFGLGDQVVYGNFVESIDGVAAIPGVKMSSAVISGGAPADRFVMALLRATADAIVIGSGTFREHDGPWTAERAHPPTADLIRPAREMVSAIGAAPTLVVVTASGGLPADHPALASALVATTSAGARALAQKGVPCAALIDVGESDDVDPGTVISRLRDRGYRRILTEGGPSLMGSMLEASVVDELFVTISPKLFGGGDGRPPLTGEADLLGKAPDARLVSVRRADDYLFLRYRLRIGALT
jgi:riboflavin biosynthesis pyrimidine reductase